MKTVSLFNSKISNNLGFMGLYPFLGYLKTFLSIYSAGYLIQGSIRRHLRDNGQLGAAVRRLDAGRYDNPNFENLTLRAPNLRHGHPVRGGQAPTDGNNNDNNFNNINNNDNINNINNDNNNGRAHGRHDVRRTGLTAKWLTMGYRETLGDLMT